MVKNTGGFVGMRCLPRSTVIKVVYVRREGAVGWWVKVDDSLNFSRFNSLRRRICIQRGLINNSRKFKWIPSFRLEVCMSAYIYHAGSLV